MLGRIKSVVFISLLALASSAHANDAIGYFGLEPDIITNYITTRSKPGYVRVTVEIMIKNSDNMETIEHHSPMIRDALINIIGKEPEEIVKSLTGREELRTKCTQAIKKLLKQETGDELIHDLLFTKYLYH